MAAACHRFMLAVSGFAHARYQMAAPDVVPDFSVCCWRKMRLHGRDDIGWRALLDITTRTHGIQTDADQKKTLCSAHYSSKR